MDTRSLLDLRNTNERTHLFKSIEGKTISPKSSPIGTPRGRGRCPFQVVPLSIADADRLDEVIDEYDCEDLTLHGSTNLSHSMEGTPRSCASIRSPTPRAVLNLPPCRAFSLRPQYSMTNTSESSEESILSLPGLENLNMDDFVDPEEIYIDSELLEGAGFEVGSGGQARILRAELNDEIIVVKISESCGILREYALISQFEHPNIVRPIGFSLLVPHATEGGESRPLFMACYEYAENGDLAAFLARNPRRRTDQRFIKRMCQSILSALEHIHKQGYIHSDIKPENILVMSDERVRLADFGMCQKIGCEMVPQGTPSYLAPEMVAGWLQSTPTHSFTTAADIFSFGVLVSRVLTNKYPFRRLTQRLSHSYQFSEQELEEFFSQPRHLLRELESMDSKYSEIVSLCLAPAPEKRPSASHLRDLLTGISPTISGSHFKKRRTSSSIPNMIFSGSVH